jgi:hypothetical protein
MIQLKKCSHIYNRGLLFQRASTIKIQHIGSEQSRHHHHISLAVNCSHHEIAEKLLISIKQQSFRHKDKINVTD